MSQKILRLHSVMSNSISLYILNYTDIGAEFGDVRPLDKARIRTLSLNGVQLLDLIHSNDAFVSELASPAVGVITWRQRDHLMHIVQPRDRNDKLLEFLTRRSVADFEKFTKVLSKEQAHLVPLLVTDGGETFYVQVLNHQIEVATPYAPPL